MVTKIIINYDKNPTFYIHICWDLEITHDENNILSFPFLYTNFMFNNNSRKESIKNTLRI